MTKINLILSPAIVFFRHLNCQVRRRVFNNVALVAVLSVAAITAAPVSVQADEVFGDFEYTLTDGEVTITKYTGSEAYVTIPNYINDNPVVVIGSWAFSSNRTLEGVEIPAGVTAIKSSAFRACNNLQHVDIPEGVTDIGSEAFQSCWNMTWVALPGSLNDIGSYAFRYCSKLADINFPEGLETIGGGAFYNCNSLKSITFPTTLKNLHNEAFRSCQGLKHVTFLGRIVEIYNHVFYDCWSLETVDIRGRVYYIDDSVFGQCMSLHSVVFHQYSPSTYSEAFYGYADDFCVYYPMGDMGYSTPLWGPYPAKPYRSQGPAWSYSVDFEENPGWFHSYWYDWFYTEDMWDGWIYSGYHGWQYVTALEDEFGVVLYDDASGHWIFTSEEYYPWMYDYTDEGWICYMDGVAPARRFYDANSDTVFNEAE